MRKRRCAVEEDLSHTNKSVGKLWRLVVEQVANVYESVNPTLYPKFNRVGGYNMKEMSEMETEGCE